MLDMGPYYITDLVNLLGPVARVAGDRDARRAPSATITSEPLQRHDDSGRGRDPRRRHAGIRLGRRRHDRA